MQTHRIHRDRGGDRAHLFGGDFHHFAADLLVFRAGIVIAALAAYAMWKLALVALRTFSLRLGLQEIVSATAAAAALGMTSFWIRHGFLSFLKCCPTRIANRFAAIACFAIPVNPAVGT